MAAVIPYGKAKGKSVADAAESDLRWVASTLEEKLQDEPDGRFADGNREILAAIREELAKRGVAVDGGPGGAPQRAQRPPSRSAPAQATRPQASAMTRAAEQPQTIVAGTFNNAAAASAALLEAGRKYHLIAPAKVVGSIPDGFEVVVSIVQIDPYGREVYAITGDRNNPKDDDTVGLDKIALSKIARAAGVSWVSSRRTDDGSHPHYCAWEAACTIPDFTLNPPGTYFGNVDIDTREDGDVCGPAAQEIRNKGKNRPDKGASQLLELRKFLMRHCESKAMNKAIGSIVHRSYKRADLNKPFAVARLAFTGASADPEARREFRQMIGQRFLGATQQLYGGNAPHPKPAQPLPTAAPAYQLHAPPPIGMTVDQGYGHEPERDHLEGMEQPYETPAPRPTPKPAPQPPADHGANEYASEERL